MVAVQKANENALFSTEEDRTKRQVTLFKTAALNHSATLPRFEFARIFFHR
jgi:hypothetical protein